MLNKKYYIAILSIVVMILIICIYVNNHLLSKNSIIEGKIVTEEEFLQELNDLLKFEKLKGTVDLVGNGSYQETVILAELLTFDSTKEVTQDEKIIYVLRQQVIIHIYTYY